MKLLEERILKEGTVLPGNVLKVGSFLNQQIDTTLLSAIAKEVSSLYKDAGVNKILTIEASGIAIAAAIGIEMGVPVVFAKKHHTSNVDDDTYSAGAHSYTHDCEYNMIVSKSYLTSDDVVLICDDFLAKGGAINGLISLVEQAGAKLAGCAIEIEKAFQGGGDALRAKGIRVESLAMIEKMTDTEVIFRR